MADVKDPRQDRPDEAALGAFLTGLGAVVEGVKETQARMDRFAATRFSVFRYFKANENTISRIFADLLRPDGRHGQGGVFLELFLKEIDRNRPKDVRYRRAKDYRVADGVVVETEHAIPKNKRRIDILVRMGETGDQYLVIENKPWAGEQDAQLASYTAYAHCQDPEACVVYLSGDGSEADTIPEEKHAYYRTMPYREMRNGSSVESWIRRCAGRCDADRVRWFLMDILRYIQSTFRNEGIDDDE